MMDWYLNWFSDWFLTELASSAVSWPGSTCGKIWNNKTMKPCCLCILFQICTAVGAVLLYSSLMNGLATKVEKSRKQLKERKNRAKKIRGVKKTKAGDAAKKKK